VAFWKDGAAIEGCAARRGVKPMFAKAVGRIRRRRSVSGMVWGDCGAGGVAAEES
jgi:hypothetical protein